jgi:5-methylcytosine-specific restriction enzyme A
MSEYAVIVQNDESKWDDVKGDLYHYPSMYRNILTPGCRIIYYKGRMTNPAFGPHRLSPEQHYFGIGVIGDSIQDPESDKGDRYCEILDYQEFEEEVLSKIAGNYLEEIPAAKRYNYWRFGVRETSNETYANILAQARTRGYMISLPSEHNDLESFDLVEGKKRVRYSAYYERNPFYRNKAIEIHGFSCLACGFSFQKLYGELGKGYIHVHHNKPISESGATRINPRTDMSVLCPNCHAMAHRDKHHTRTVTELRKLIHNSLQATGNAPG